MEQHLTAKRWEGFRTAPDSKEVHLHVCMYVCMYVYIHVCVCMYVYIHMSRYECI